MNLLFLLRLTCSPCLEAMERLLLTAEDFVGHDLQTNEESRSWKLLVAGASLLVTSASLLVARSY